MKQGGIVIFLLALIFSGCSDYKENISVYNNTQKGRIKTALKKGKNSVVKPALGITKWADLIVAHTDQKISRFAAINIYLKEESGLKKIPMDLVKLSPQVSGTLTLRGNQLRFLPKAPLKSGEKYRVSVDLEKLYPGLPQKFQTFEFDFDVITQQLELNIEGMVSRKSGDVIIGSVMSADDIKLEDVTKLLVVKQDQKVLDIVWRSVTNRRYHYTIKGVKRFDKRSIVTIVWDNSVIGIKGKGIREVPIPAKKQFQVMEIKAVNGDQQYIQVRFTKPLDPKQDLRGLITLKGHRERFSIDGNVVKVYFARQVTGHIRVNVAKEIKSIEGKQLKKERVSQLYFEEVKPFVHFVGKGVILPGGKKQIIPFEAGGLHSVQVTAFKVFPKNMGQFLQTNNLSGTTELKRVGRYIWRKEIKLSAMGDVVKSKTRYNLDVTELFQKHPNSLFRLTLSADRNNSAYSCTENIHTPVPARKALQNYDDWNIKEQSSWDNAENYYNKKRQNNYRHRYNPCYDYYYRYNRSKVISSRNLVSANIGLIAKIGADQKLHVATTDIQRGKPLGGVRVTAFSFQNSEIVSKIGDQSGLMALDIDDTRPYYLVAQKGDQRGYLKLNDDSVRPVSHFDIGGEKVKKGVKGHIYGERGIWRPGDAIFLTFVLENKQNYIPKNHPVMLHLYNPAGARYKTFRPIKTLNNFYAFKLRTKEEDQTGLWRAEVQIGGLKFSKMLRIETVVPNRLKVNLTLDGEKELLAKNRRHKGKLVSQWLHGAPASGLNYDIGVNISNARTQFSRFQDHQFDDPARVFRGYSEKLLTSGALNKRGEADIKFSFSMNQSAPGMLKASFMTRVHEESGDFSTDTLTVPFHRYKHYIGIKPPKGDAARGMLLTDQKQTVSVVALDYKGEPTAVKKVTVSLYKLSWKWWWDKSSESPARFSSAVSKTAVTSGEIAINNQGMGSWEFEIKYPKWGRYMIRACDVDGGHCSGKIVYIDWPGWAGRAKEEKGVGASQLSFTCDKKKYTVGENAVIYLPATTEGRALVSVENSGTIISQRWIEMKRGKNRVVLPITAEMSPNGYIDVTMIQPHENKKNDAPIRLYGVVPVIVDNPKTALKPFLEMVDTIKPLQTLAVKISETQKRPMTYTIAMVDEGLLGLTRFKTPDLRKIFYRREALGIKTWDMFDFVVGAYGAELERVLGLGGDEDEEDNEKRDKKKRFPPLVSFLGPFQLKAGAVATHKIKIPKYFGAVRVMVVAGDQKGAYGKVSKSIPVISDLMVMGTLPRVVGPNEEIELPVTAFRLKPEVIDATLSVEHNDLFSVIGEQQKKITFDPEDEDPDEIIETFRLKVANKVGKGYVKVIAKSGDIVVDYSVYIDVRSPNVAQTVVQSGIIEPGKTWRTIVKPIGIPGSNETTLEVSAVPPLNLEARLGYLIRYPHGCIEQTISSVFPQLYLKKLTKLNKQQIKDVEHNINSAIEHLGMFQHHTGGFSYWPGGNRVHPWGTNYAYHFLIEASRQGFYIPQKLMTKLTAYQQNSAKAWGNLRKEGELIQAYRLFTLALDQKPELSGMNRLREMIKLQNQSRWMLATAFHLAGQKVAAKSVLKREHLNLKEYRELGNTFGSSLRDQGMLLYLLSLMGERKEAITFAISLSQKLSKKDIYTTQETAYALMGMGAYLKGSSTAYHFAILTSIGADNQTQKREESGKPVLKRGLKEITNQESMVSIENPGKSILYGSVITRGVPAAGRELKRSNGLDLSVHYSQLSRKKDGLATISTLSGDVYVKATVKNNSHKALENIVLTVMIPAGTEFSGNANYRKDSSIKYDYVDVRDDRIHYYFSMKRGQKATFGFHLNPSFCGKFYLPGVYAETMYDPETNGATKGEWIEIK